jgi:hypothetical protein
MGSNSAVRVSDTPTRGKAVRFTSPNVAGIPPKLPGESEHDHTMRLARMIMDRDANILRELAK